MERISRTTSLPSLACLALAFALALAGCAAPTTNTANTSATGTNANTAPAANANTAPAADTAGASQMPVTLPVLDAMFADESFAGELKSRLQLTDEQIERLRKVAEEETVSLREGEGEEHGGTTSAATARATEKIGEVIGRDKAQAFSSFVRERWNGGATAAGGAASGARPNAVPADTRVVVNAPAYRMDVFENGQLVKSYKIGIGYPEFPLPQGMRKANSIIFNPTWTPPDEPWVEGGRSKVKVGQKVEAGSPLNPLGPVKIPIGLPSLIHGGKSPAKLGSFASHGCVGLTNPQVQDFSLLLAKLGGAELTKEDVDAYAKKKTETKDVKLANAVPVELRYETIVAEDGRLRIYRDVYDKDTNTEENLRAVLAAHGVSLEQLSEQERAQVQQALQEMARDAKGQPTSATAATPTPSPSPAAGKNANANSKANANSNANSNANTGGRVTSTVKGKKEVVIEIAALKGKGYPAPAGEGFTTPKQTDQKGAGAAAKKGAKR